MSTNVTGLRNAADFMRQATSVDPVWLREAADEIDRLRIALRDIYHQANEASIRNIAWDALKTAQGEPK
jgi:hypothetical protein